jgi:quercetin dioxygenase-like cupin family protein
MRNLEMWYETVASGNGTPIHTHDCEEVFLVLSGSGGAMKIQALDGRVITQKLSAKSTITVLPNAKHQLVNNGDDDVTFVVAFDNAPMRATAFPTWEAKQGKLMGPLPWDAQCPSQNPDASALAKEVGGSNDEKSEL